MNHCPGLSAIPMPLLLLLAAAFASLGMQALDHGRAVERQAEASPRPGLRVLHAPVSDRRRVGTFRMSGAIGGVLATGAEVLLSIFLAAPWGRRLAGPRRSRLVVFTRWPEPGTTKTRLIPVLGPAGAADLQRQMTVHTIAWADTLRRRRGVEVDVSFEGGSAASMRAWLGSDRRYTPQVPGDIGMRMRRAAERALAAGVERVVIVGTDCPGLNADLAQNAFDMLRHDDVVFGPAIDGGYYLLGLRRPVPALFDGIEWGTGRVFQQSLAAAARAGASVAVLPPLADVDRPADLPLWERARAADAATETISVIIPALDEADAIAHTLAAAAAPGVEVIVVDGGSRDGTLDRARAWGARVIRTEPGRARQMNAGAAAATGDIVLFLHADTRLPARFGDHVRDTLRRRGVIAGAFHIRLDAPGASLRIIERGINWRSRRLRMPYGDQALFLRASVFRYIRGFSDLPILEDRDLVKRLNRIGRVALAPATVLTSARRWQTLGPWRTTLANQQILAAHALGLPMDRIAKWYRAH